MIDTASNEVATRVAVGERPASGVILPDSSAVYVPDIGDGSISVIGRG